MLWQCCVRPNRPRPPFRHRLIEPVGTVRCTAAVATMQFAMRTIVADFLLRYPKLNVVAHATDENVDIVGENYDIAVRAHTEPLPDSTLVQRTLTPGAMVPVRRLGLSRCQRGAADAQRSAKLPLPVHDAHRDCSGLAAPAFQQGEGGRRSSDAPVHE